ncbi:hypothetical protein TNCV_521541 [Trichonephila clavipes]|nr:hypothetical protein TNCV_521541 [Trichonephila clavipes]
MCTNCSFESASPAHILGLTKQDLADDPLLVLDILKVYEVIGRALLTNGGVQQQQHVIFIHSTQDRTCNLRFSKLAPKQTHS